MWWDVGKGGVVGMIIGDTMIRFLDLDSYVFPLTYLDPNFVYLLRSHTIRSLFTIRISKFSEKRPRLTMIICKNKRTFLSMFLGICVCRNVLLARVVLSFDLSVIVNLFASFSLSLIY